MDPEDHKLFTESQSSGSPASVGTGSGIFSFDKTSIKLPSSTPESLSPMMSPKIMPTSKGVENAKKRLRAFSIQKKNPIASMAVPKPVTAGNTTVLIGKLNNVKATPKPDDPVAEPKKPPKPPKPGTSKRNIQDYMDQQKKTLSEIEDMKRNMELVELGIPLGLICPSPHNYKAMPTKAMPPIKTFLGYTGIIPVTPLGNSAKVNEIILEAKKARAEGKKFKFDYQKLLPDYDNPFQRKKDEAGPADKDMKIGDWDHKIKERRKSDKYDRSYSFRRVDKGKYRDNREKIKDEKKYRGKEIKKEKDEQKGNAQKDPKETDVNLNDYLVCDSWSLDNEDKSNSSPKVDDSVRIKDIRLPKDKGFVGTAEELKDTESISKIEKLKPVIDSFEYEIDPNEDEILDIFDNSSGLDKYAKVTTKKIDLRDSPVPLKLFDDSTMSKDGSDVNDDKFLQSVINEIKGDDTCEDVCHDKGLVEYDVSPARDESQSDMRGSVTPELKTFNLSQTSDYSDSYRSVESGYKSTESGYKSNVSAESQFMMSTERVFQGNVSRSTMSSLEIWSFVLKICQPLLFRHDKNKCYKETQTIPKLWYTENPRICNCVKDRSIVYEELEMFKMNLVDRVYGCDQISDTPFPAFRSWYPRSAHCLAEDYAVQLSADDDWEADDNQVVSHRNNRGSMTPQKNEEIYLDREYQKFMQALSDVSEHKTDNSRSTTPVAMENKAGEAEEKRKAKKRFSSEGWSQESDMEEEVEKNKKLKLDKEKQRKRKHSTSSATSSSEDQSKRKKKSTKKKDSKKSKISKRRRLNKKYLKKLKEKQKKKKRLMKLVQDSDEEDDDEKERLRKEKKSKKKKQQKLKHSKQKKKKSKAKSSSSSESSTTSESSSSETDSELEKRSKKRKKAAEAKQKKHKKPSSEFQNNDLFDVNILKNIKTERITDDEKQITPRKKPREIINVKELQNDFVGNNIHIKMEVEEKMIVDPIKSSELSNNELQQNEKEPVTIEADNNVEELDKDVEIHTSVEQEDVVEQQNIEDVECLQSTSEVKEVEIIEKGKEVTLKVQTGDGNQTTPQHRPVDESSQCSSQESTSKEAYEKDESHLRPSSQNSNYNFNDVIASHSSYPKEDPEDKFQEGYEQGNYEMYEQLAMAYQSDLDTQMKGEEGERRIETVVRVRARGEIKCDWRAGDEPLLTHHRPSRWGLKPGEVNIVLTGGGTATEQFPIRSVVDPQPVYKIQSLANRSDNCSISYDEAYMDTYGALDRLQYGDCFSETAAPDSTRVQGSTTITTSSLDERISQALQNSVLSELAKDTEDDTETDKDAPEKGILITKPVVQYESVRAGKRVSFADGYKPGQDSDVEEPPVKKRKRARRVGCAWPCPASHPDHVPLWDALPPPPPPPGSPPSAHHHHQPQPINTKFDPSVSLLNFMPPEPPPGILTF